MNTTIAKLIELGNTTSDLAIALGVTRNTIRKYAADKLGEIHVVRRVLGRRQLLVEPRGASKQGEGK